MSRHKSNRLCSVEGCGCKHSAKGFCSKHWFRMNKYGRLNLERRERGSGRIKSNGYIETGNGDIVKYNHVWIAERALGKALPEGAEVHHIDGNRANNAPSNLIICPDSAYHKLLHKRMRAFEKCGNANYHKCKFCKKYDAPENMCVPGKPRYSSYHLKCDALYARSTREKNGTISFEKRRERVHLVKVKLNEGMKIADLAAEFGLSLSSISCIKRELGKVI